MKKDVIDVEFTEEEIKTSCFLAKLNAYTTCFIVVLSLISVIWYALEKIMYGYTIESLEDTIIGILFSVVLTYFIVNRKK